MPLTQNDPRFQVDDAVFTGFEAHDTRNNLSPQGPTSARLLRFPGSSNGYAVKGTDRPAPLIVDGILQAAGFDELYALIDQHNAWVASTGIVKVTLHETDYPNCTPMRFQLTGQPQEYSPDGTTIGAEVPARIIFERLA